MSYYWRPYRFTSRKYETEEDVKDVIKFVSDFIIANSYEQWVSGNMVDNPVDIIEQPEKIANQFINQQKTSLIAGRCRRVYPLCYVFNTGMPEYPDFESLKILSERLMGHYHNHQCISVICNQGGQMALFFIFNNISNDSEKLTAPGKFKPQLLFEDWSKGI